MQNPQSTQGLYTKLCTNRDIYLDRARDAAKLTIPMLIPDEGNNASSTYSTPFQSVGARGVNNLASALLLSLLPPNAPFFRLVLDEKAKRDLEQIDPTIKNEIDHTMSEIERSIMREVEISGLRTALFSALKHLIVGGNVLLHIPDEGRVRVFPMNRYVVARDPSGNVRKIIVKESVTPDTLPKDLQEQAKAALTGTSKTVDVYTCAHTDDKGKVKVYQETSGVIIPGTKATYPKNKGPFLALRMIQIDGEDWGRGYVEQYMGDLKSLEALSQAIVEGSAAAAKVLFRVNSGRKRSRCFSSTSGQTGGFRCCTQYDADHSRASLVCIPPY